MNSPSNDNQIYNNTLLGNGKSFAVFTYRGKIPNQSGTKVYHNLYSGELQFVEGNFAPEVRGNVFVKAEPLLSPSPSNMVLERIAEVNLPAVASQGTASTASAIGAYETGKPFWKPGPRDP